MNYEQQGLRLLTFWYSADFEASNSGIQNYKYYVAKYREFLPYANFITANYITANFITAVFQNYY